MESSEADTSQEIVGEFEPFQVESLRENVEVNLAMILVTILAIILSILLLPRLYVGVTWNG